MRIHLNQIPQYAGYHQAFNAKYDNYTLALMNENGREKLALHAFLLITKDIVFSYTPASVLDFKHSKVIITYSFSYPQLINTGNMVHSIYVSGKRDYMKLEISSLKVNSRDFNAEMADLRKVDDYTFEADYQ